MGWWGVALVGLIALVGWLIVLGAIRLTARTLRRAGVREGSVGSLFYEHEDLEPGESATDSFPCACRLPQGLATEGILYLTDRRLIFTGSHGFLRPRVPPTSIPYESITSWRIQRRRMISVRGYIPAGDALVIGTTDVLEYVYWPGGRYRFVERLARRLPREKFVAT